MQAIAAQEFLELVPETIRERLKLRPGTVLDFDEQAPFLKAVPAEPVDGTVVQGFDDWIARGIGISKVGRSTDEILNETRGED